MGSDQPEDCLKYEAKANNICYCTDFSIGTSDTVS